MRVREQNRIRRARGIAAAAIAIALAAAACSANSTGGSAPTTGGGTATTAKPATVTTVAGTGPGVTATSIKLGIALIDYACIPAAFYTGIRPAQQKAYQAFIDDINAHGGINGRTIEPIYKTVCPLTPTQGLSACTSFADDANVFAVIGTFGDITGDVPLCVTRQHQRILITYDLSQDLIDKAPPGLLLTPDILPDRRVKVIMSLLTSQHTLEGKTVAILADSNANARVQQVIEPAIASTGAKRGSTAILTISGTDTAAAQSQLDSFIEKWKTEGVDTLMLAGDAVESKQFIEKIRSAFPKMTLIADSTGVLSGAQDEVKAKVVPNPYDGIITAEGRTGLEHTKTPHFTFCKNIFEKATGIKVPSPNVVIPAAGGRENEIYGEEEDACVFVEMFKTIAEKVGANLNNANWTATVDNFGSIDIMSTDFASLHTGKYDADNTYGLVAFDPTIGDAGDWKRVTPVLDVSGD